MLSRFVPWFELVALELEIIDTSVECFAYESHVSLGHEVDSNIFLFWFFFSYDPRSSAILPDMTSSASMATKLRGKGNGNEGKKKYIKSGHCSPGVTIGCDANFCIL